MSFTDPNG
jgi:hypothetical protein